MATEHSELLTRAQDPLALLSDDHQKVLELFDRFEAALEEEAEDELEDIAHEICDELEIHAELEEEIFYPAAAEHAELVTLVEQAQQEHDDVKAMIEEIRAASADDGELEGLMQRLQEAVETHVREEENVMFPQAEELLEDRLEELGERLARRKEELTAGRE